MPARFKAPGLHVLQQRLRNTTTGERLGDIPFFGLCRLKGYRFASRGTRQPTTVRAA